MKRLFVVLSLLINPLWSAEKEEPSMIVLESNFIGDKEQPSVSYFIPWSGIGTPDKLQWQISDKVDRTLDLVDRKVMRRSTAIYQELNLEQLTVVNQEK